MATLSGYITEVRRLLHDANGNFYSDSELTDYINEGRQHTVQDTGCLRKLQVTQTPTTPVVGGRNPTPFAANTYYNQDDYVFSNVYIYRVTTAGTSDDSGIPYPTTGLAYPPTTEFFVGGVGLTYAGPVEIINYAALPDSLYTLDILNINIYWGNSRIPLRYMPWSQFNADVRFWQNYIGRPVVFSVYGQGQIYIAPVPDQVYPMELDTVVQPTPLVTSLEVDEIKEPYSSCVKFYAAYIAKYKEQSYGEAEIFKQEYIKAVQQVLSTTFTRRLPSAYGNGY
jgi:hypothetical protein